VGIAVDDLAAATTFFVEVGLNVLGGVEHYETVTGSAICAPGGDALSCLRSRLADSFGSQPPRNRLVR
jgi:hypothetical protein